MRAPFEAQNPLKAPVATMLLELVGVGFTRVRDVEVDELLRDMISFHRNSPGVFEHLSARLNTYLFKHRLNTRLNTI